LRFPLRSLEASGLLDLADLNARRYRLHRLADDLNHRGQQALRDGRQHGRAHVRLVKFLAGFAFPLEALFSLLGSRSNVGRYHGVLAGAAHEPERFLVAVAHGFELAM